MRGIKSPSPPSLKNALLFQMLKLGHMSFLSPLSKKINFKNDLSIFNKVTGQYKKAGPSEKNVTG